MTESSPFIEEKLPDTRTWTEKVRDQLSQENFPTQEIDQILPTNAHPVDAYAFHLIASQHINDIKMAFTPEHIEGLFWDLLFQPSTHYDQINRYLDKYRAAAANPKSLLFRHIQIQRQQREAAKHVLPFLENSFDPNQK